jgi:hypothetical protein
LIYLVRRLISAIKTGAKDIGDFLFIIIPLQKVDDFNWRQVASFQTKQKIKELFVCRCSTIINNAHKFTRYSLNYPQSQPVQDPPALPASFYFPFEYAGEIQNKILKKKATSLLPIPPGR